MNKDVIDRVKRLPFKLSCPTAEPASPELRWRGKKPIPSLTYCSAQKIESYGKPVNDWMNRIYWGDNLQVMGHLLDKFAATVDLVYLDPPFNSHANYKKTITLKNDESASKFPSHEEVQYGDIWNDDDYLQFVYLRLIILRSLLNATGTIYLHCDSEKAYYMRMLLDEVFGRSKFINEIIWHYTGGGRSEKYFSKKHDSILVYSKTGNYIFNGDAIRIPYKKTSSYARAGIVSKTGKVYKPNPLGTIPDDVWDIPIINPLSYERLGYPTQKPEALLERIIKTSSQPGSLVLDCFMGSGTTQAIAMKLGRRFIGADINMGAIQTTIQRLATIMAGTQAQDDSFRPYLNFDVYTVNNNNMFQNQLQATELIMRTLQIEKLDNKEVFDGIKNDFKVRIMPFNRIATYEDLNPIINFINSGCQVSRQKRNEPEEFARIMLVCMGHEPDLAAYLKKMLSDKLNVEVAVVDILQNKQRLAFKYESEADIAIVGNELVVRKFYPRQLLSELSLKVEQIGDWRQLVESIAIDWNYADEILKPQIFDCPGKKGLVKGRYRLPSGHGSIRIKITDLLSETLEQTI